MPCPHAERARARLGDQDLCAALVDIALAHHAGAGERWVHVGTRTVGTDRHPRGAATTQIVKAVSGLHNDHLGVTHLARQAGAVLDFGRPQVVGIVDYRASPLGSRGAQSLGQLAP
jgi:hypothetical protein